MILNIAIDSKLRPSDLIRLKVRDISSGALIQSRAIIEQKKTHREVQFEITSKTLQCLNLWIYNKKLTPFDYLFPSPRKQGTICLLKPLCLMHIYKVIIKIYSWMN